MRIAICRPQHTQLSQQLICAQAPPGKCPMSLSGFHRAIHPAMRWHSPATPLSSRSCSWLGRPLRGALCRQPGRLLRSPL